MEDRRALSAKPARWLRVNRAGLFCAAVFAMLYSAIAYAGSLAAIGGVVLLAGLPVYWVSRHSRRANPAEDGR